MTIFNKQELFEQMDDIISSGAGEFGEWHQGELTELFDRIDDKQELEKLVAEYYNGDCEGVTIEEVKWVADYFGKTVKISFV